MPLNSICGNANVFRPLFKTAIDLRTFQVTSTATIISKFRREPDYKRPKPWPYNKKKYTILHYLYFDGTYKRFDENTKLIVVDGNIGAGKTTLAKQLAEEFDMLYVPEPDMAKNYITPYGYDLRQLDPIMPRTFKSCDLKKFYEDPHFHNVTLFQFRMFLLRYKGYLDTMEHLLNTGQGMVMDRSVFSDIVFIDAMYRAGYVTKECRDYYDEVYNNVVMELMQPCLVIYLDISPEVALERIKQRNDPIEVNSKVLTHEYLANIERSYKQRVLRYLSKRAELLIYDWSNFGDLEIVIEDIERIDFENYDYTSPKLEQWRLNDDWQWSSVRYYYSNYKARFLHYAYIFRPRIKELYHPREDCDEYLEIIGKIPGEKYLKGFNADAGDKGILFKAYNNGHRDEFVFFRPRPKLEFLGS